MQDESTQQNPPENPGWLEKLQHESWQAEILISGGGLVGVIAMFDSSGDVYEALLHGTVLPPALASLISQPIGVLAFLLAEAFLLHLVLRGYWIGLVGFNLVFPLGVNREKLVFQGKFRSIIKTNSNTPYLIRIDNLCSLIFAFTFFIVLSIAGFVLYVLLSGGVANALKNVSGLKIVRPLTSTILLAPGLLVLIDFLTFGYLKKVRWISTFYYPIHYVVSRITLSFLYRRLYYSIISNIRPVYIFIGLSINVALFVLLGSIEAKIPGSISSLRSGKEHFLVLEDDVIVGNSIRFSFSHLPSLENDLFTEWSTSHGGAPAKSFADIPEKDQLELITNAYVITVDSVQAKNLIWTSSNRLVLGFWTTRLLYIADVGHLARGRHELAMRMRLNNAEYTTDSLGYYAKASFLLDK